jgi:hypothetical protein
MAATDSVDRRDGRPVRLEYAAADRWHAENRRAVLVWAGRLGVGLAGVAGGTSGAAAFLLGKGDAADGANGPAARVGLPAMAASTAIVAVALLPQRRRR